MTDLTLRLNNTVDMELQERLHKEMDSFEKGFTQSIRNRLHSAIRRDDTSDDTKNIEQRPQKCDNMSIHSNIFGNDDRIKRNCPPKVSPDAISIAGPSRT